VIDGVDVHHRAFMNFQCLGLPSESHSISISRDMFLVREVRTAVGDRAGVTED
jgi:hypothetical protein